MKNKKSILFFRRFKSSSGVKAVKIDGINQISVYNCCQGTQKTAGGFKWKYKNEINI